MNVEVNNELVKTLSDFLKDGQQLVVEQSPDVIRQLILVGLIGHGIWIVFLVSVLILSIWMIYKYHKMVIDALNSDQGIPEMFPYVISWIAVFPSFIFLFINIYHFLVIVFAPKIYLIEYLSSLIKGN